MAFYSYLSTKIIIAFITKSYQDLFGVRSYINAFLFYLKTSGYILYYYQLFFYICITIGALDEWFSQRSAKPTTAVRFR